MNPHEDAPVEPLPTHDTAPSAEASTATSTENPTDTDPDHPVGRIVSLLLEPRGLQILMGAGGGLLALGLVIWLAVIGLFDNPVVAATGLGAANLALLGVGVGLVLRTGHAIAGRGVAMLACLLLPLNLWFYDAQGLITLSGGGNLWLPALVCCVVYAGVARVLKDSLFVYAFTAGVAMTGLLFLADGDVGHFWEVLAPSTLLVAIGVAAVHAERLFPVACLGEQDQPFTRGDFGLAFFRAGHVAMAAGLGVLLMGRVVGRLYGAVFEGFGWFVQPDVATLVHVQLAALGLTLAGAYTYVYSRLVRGGDRFTLMAVLMVAWSAVVGADLVGLETHGTLVGLSLISVATLAVGRVYGNDTAETGGAVGQVFAALGGALLAANRLLAGEAEWALFGLLLPQFAATLGAMALARAGHVRRSLAPVLLCQLLVSGFVVNAVSALSFWQRVEAVGAAAGLGLVAAGLVGWRRELADGSRDALANTPLWLGGLMATLPATLGLLGVRLDGADVWCVVTHEVGVLALGLTLVGFGVLCRLRSLTLTGGGALTVYVLSLVLLLHVPDQLQNVAFYLMAGGGALFGASVLLSVYRDHVLALPDRVRRGAGVWAVLKWR